MEKIPYKNKIGQKTKALITILSLFLIGIIAGQIIANVGIANIKEIAENLDIDIGSKAAKWLLRGYNWLITVTCIDIVLLIGLLYIYLNLFKETKSSFMLGLNFFIVILLIKAVLSIAYLFTFFNESIVNLPNTLKTMGTTGFGVLGFFINIFEIIAISILLYLSME